MKSAKIWFVVLCLGIYISLSYTLYFFESLGNGKWVQILRLTAIFTMICTYGYVVIISEKAKQQNKRFSVFKLRLTCFVLILFSISASGSAFMISKERNEKESYKKDENYKILNNSLAREEGILKSKQEELNILKNSLKTENGTSNAIAKEYESKIKDVETEGKRRVNNAKEKYLINNPVSGAIALERKYKNEIEKLKIERDKKIDLSNQSKNKTKKEIQLNINSKDKEIEKVNTKINKIEEKVIKYKDNNKTNITGYEIFLKNIFGNKVGKIISNYLYLILSILLEIIIVQVMEYVFITCRFKLTDYLDNKLCRIVKNYFVGTFSKLTIKSISNIQRDSLKKNEIGVNMLMNQIKDYEIKKDETAKLVEKKKVKVKNNSKVKELDVFSRKIYKIMIEHYKKTNKVLSVRKIADITNEKTNKIQGAREILLEMGLLESIKVGNRKANKIIIKE